MTKTNYLLLGVAALASILVSVGDAQAKKKIYQCPDLHNATKRTIEPLTQGFDGWFYRRNDLKTDFTLSPESEQYFKRLNEALKSRDITLVMAPLLSRAMLSKEMVNDKEPWQELYDIGIAEQSYRDLIQQLRNGGIITKDLYQVFLDEADGDPYDYNFKRDIHWKPKGTELFVKAIAPLITNIPGYDKLTKIEVTNTPKSEIGRYGTIMEELQRLCTSSIKAESFTLLERKQKINKNADALFGGSASTTPIALVGSSFSAQDEFSFPAYMEQYTGLEVANFAIPAGGMFTSITSYLSTPYFHQNKPFALLWETQTIYNYNEGVEQKFRQIIPAVYGVCEGENLIANNKVNISKKPSYDLLTKLASKKISGEDYYLYLYSDNLGFNQFSLQIEYDDEDGEWFSIDRSELYTHKGHYYIELSDKISSNLSHVTIEDVQNRKANLTVKLCKKPTI